MSVRMRDADADSVAAPSDDETAPMEGDSGSSGDSYGDDYGSNADSDGGGGCGGSDESEEAALGLASGDEEGGGGGGGRGGAARYRIITGDSLKALQRGAIDEVTGIFGYSGGVAKTMLMAYRWDKDRLLNDLGDKGYDHVCHVAGLASTQQQQDGGAASAAAAAKAGPGATATCGVCMSDVPAGEVSTNSCGHAFCDDCWRGHLGVQIGEGKACHVSCMAFKCGVVADEELVERVLKGQGDALAKYRQSHLESYLEDNPRVAFCPSAPWCGHAVQVDSDPYVEPECPCGVSFCFKCRDEPHSPCTCKMWQMWQEKISGDSETRNWLQANTKPCPKCGKPVEKNGGCNLVVCQCRQPFCWLCGQATGMQHTWTSIANHSCGRFKDEMDARMGEAARNHKRYMFYFERFKAHADSIKKEKANRAKLLARIAASEHDGVEARDFGWLVGALDQLRTARRVLCNSYAFAFGFFGGALFAEDFTPEQNAVNQNLFEDNQEMLAAEVERLSGLADKAAETLSLDSELRLLTINSTTNVATRIANFFHLISDDLYSRVSSLSAQIAAPA
ncbi:MAG: hypothetical protein J3K34DRAFT_204977 [Monoraphidium minutum]|nr:MAG: hypothetical protein J3K34DRAFT_204977 [Monoraphidium minutum]